MKKIISTILVVTMMFCNLVVVNCIAAENPSALASDKVAQEVQISKFENLKNKFKSGWSIMKSKVNKKVLSTMLMVLGIAGVINYSYGCYRSFQTYNVPWIDPACLTGSFRIPGYNIKDCKPYSPPKNEHLFEKILMSMIENIMYDNNRLSLFGGMLSLFVGACLLL